MPVITNESRMRAFARRTNEAGARMRHQRSRERIEADIAGHKRKVQAEKQAQEKVTQ